MTQRASRGTPRTPHRPHRRILTPQVIVGICLAMLVVGMLASPLQVFYHQRAQQHALEQENAQLIRAIARKKEQLELQKDPRAIEEQARLRLLLIPRGETGFRVITPPRRQPAVTGQQQTESPTSPAPRRSLVLTGEGPWIKDLWLTLSIPPAQTAPPEESNQETPSAS